MKKDDFYIWLVILLFFMACISQFAKATSVVKSDLPVTCRVLVFNIHTDSKGFETMSSELADVKGVVTKIISDDYFRVDFTRHMTELKLIRRWNDYEQDRIVTDCAFRVTDILGI